MKKYIPQILIIMLILSSYINVTPNSVAAKSNPLRGKAGKNITWTYNTKTHTMTFKGKGPFYKTEGTSDTPGYIGSWGCWTDDVEHVVIGEGITVIARESFANTAKLKDVKLPSTLTKIGNSAFAFSSVCKINFPKNLKVIGCFAFCDCVNLKNITLPYGLERIEGLAFSGSESKSLVIPDSVTYIGDGAFGDKLEKIKLSKNLTYIGEGAIGGSKIKKIVIPQKVKTIKNNMFYECKKLKEVKLGKNVEHIEHEAFAYTAIERIVLPKNVTTLGYGELREYANGMFEGCKKLKLVEFRSKKITDVYKTTFLNTPKDVVFRVPKGKLEEYTKLFREGGLAQDIVIEESTEW
ncbi:MAG: leucine-rich repeat domain-containing protein [Lachnospiraceae bacterium]|nr:leucine-rich repeat domain-containing protein [Lachnospiraceae bacterium]